MGWSTTQAPPCRFRSSTCDLDGFRHQLEVNLVGPLAVTQALLPLLRRAQGRVVNVTSAAGKAGVPLMAPYVAAKHGLEGLSDVMRLEFRLLGIQVAVIEPGFVGTAMGGKLQATPKPRITPIARRGPAQIRPGTGQDGRDDQPARGYWFAARSGGRCGAGCADQLPAPHPISVRCRRETNAVHAPATCPTADSIGSCCARAD